LVGDFFTSFEESRLIRSAADAKLVSSFGFLFFEESRARIEK